MSGLLQIDGLSVQIEQQTICEGLELAIRPGQCWALLGRNGAGKTTLLHHLAGLRPAGHSGKILLAGSELQTLSARERARQIAVLLQHSSRGFGASVLETVLSGRHPHLSPLAWEGAADLAIAQRYIAALDLDPLADRSLATLSGGELRRVEIARLLTQQTRLSLLDEPLNHLDLAYQAGCLRALAANCVSDTRAMLMVLHDLNIAYRACDHWLILNGRGGWHAGPRHTLADPALLSAVYGHPIRRIDTDDGPLFAARL
ncbi:MAG: ABC transporter ATP-binding protein [Sedimenticolaceae bacterium]